MDIANVLNREQICDMIDQMEKNHFNESEIIRKMHRRICLNGDKHSINFIKDASSWIFSESISRKGALSDKQKKV